MSDAPLWHDAFYRFVPIQNPQELVAHLQARCDALELRGSILVAHEGINGMLAGTQAALDAFREELEQDARFSGMPYKRTVCSHMPFGRLKVKLKREIVPLGVAGVDASQKTGVNVAPERWRELITQDDVVLIDNRNDFEVRLGRFKGAQNPGVDNFREFEEYARERLDEWRHKKVAMYCTGGIRCEKASAWLVDLGLEVYQLEGGILNFFAQLPDAEQDFEGECFVFDDRVALDTKLQETGRSRAEVDALMETER